MATGGAAGLRGGARQSAIQGGRRGRGAAGGGAGRRGLTWRRSCFWREMRWASKQPGDRAAEGGHQKGQATQGQQQRRQAGRGGQKHRWRGGTAKAHLWPPAVPVRPPPAAARLGARGSRQAGGPPAASSPQAPASTAAHARLDAVRNRERLPPQAATGGANEGQSKKRGGEGRTAGTRGGRLKRCRGALTHQENTKEAQSPQRGRRRVLDPEEGRMHICEPAGRGPGGTLLILPVGQQRDCNPEQESAQMRRCTGKGGYQR